MRETTNSVQFRKIGCSLLFNLLLVAGILGTITGCTTKNPITKREQTMMVDRTEMKQLGERVYREKMEEANRVEDPQAVRKVNEVAQDIISEAEKMRRNRLPANKYVKYDWETNLLKADAPNAFALPGGKMAIYKPMVELAGNKNGLAVILGHEAAHVIARHAAERYSQQQIVRGGTAFAQIAAGRAELSEQQTQQLLSVLGIAANVGYILPYSRDHETESDRLGLRLAARAGYDPRAGPKLWQKMNKKYPNKQPEFLSTHPHHEQRIQNMKQWMPELLSIYRKQKEKSKQRFLNED